MMIKVVLTMLKIAPCETLMECAMVGFWGFVYLVLELILKRSGGDFLCHERVMVTIIGTQISIVFIVINVIFLFFGMDILSSDHGRAIAYICMIVVVLLIVNKRLIGYESQDFARHREAFEKMPRVKKIWGGIAIAIVIISSVIGAGVLGGMSGEVHRAARMSLTQI
jgi:hypothetical protein